MSTRSVARRPHAPFAALILAAALSLPAFAAPVETDVRLVLPEGATTDLVSPASLEVLAIAEPMLPVRKTAVLAKLDIQSLEKELDGERKNLSRAQAEKRRLATERKATTSAVTSNDPTALRNSQEVGAAESAEQQALAEITSLTTQIQQALVRAPEDGFLVKSLYSVGAKTKKRKPFLVFAEVSKTVLEASVPAAEATQFTAGTTVRFTSTAGDGRAFTGKVLAATPAGDAVALRVQPLEHPLFPLNSTMRFSLAPGS